MQVAHYFSELAALALETGSAFEGMQQREFEGMITTADHKLRNEPH